MRLRIVFIGCANLARHPAKRYGMVCPVTVVGSKGALISLVRRSLGEGGRSARTCCLFTAPMEIGAPLPRPGRALDRLSVGGEAVAAGDVVVVEDVGAVGCQRRFK